MGVVKHTTASATAVRQCKNNTRNDDIIHALNSIQHILPLIPPLSHASGRMRFCHALVMKLSVTFFPAAVFVKRASMSSTTTKNKPKVKICLHTSRNDKNYKFRAVTTGIQIVCSEAKATITYLERNTKSAGQFNVICTYFPLSCRDQATR